MSIPGEFPAQNARAGGGEKRAISVDLDTERPAPSESRGFSDVLLFALTPLAGLLVGWQKKTPICKTGDIRVEFGREPF
jgi:hypothetical protein